MVITLLIKLFRSFVNSYSELWILLAKEHLVFGSSVSSSVKYVFLSFDKYTGYPVNLLTFQKFIKSEEIGLFEAGLKQKYSHTGPERDFFFLLIREKKRAIIFSKGRFNIQITKFL